MAFNQISKTGVFISALWIFVMLVPLLVFLPDIFLPLFTFDLQVFQSLFDPRIIRLFLRSLWLSLAVTAGSLILAGPLAWFFSYYQFLFKKVFFVLFLLPIFIPPYILAISWLYATGSAGWLGCAGANAIISGFGGSLLVLMLWLYPLLFLFLLYAFKTGRHYGEAALLFRGFRTRATVFSYLLIKNGLLAGLVLIFVLTFINFSVPGVLGLNVFPTEIFSQFGAFYNRQQAAILSLPNLIMALVLAFWLGRQFKNMKRFATSDQLSEFKNMPVWLWVVFFTFSGTLLFFSIGIPVITLVYRISEFNIFIHAIPDLSGQWINTFLFSLAGACVICVVALYISLLIRRDNRLFMPMVMLALLPFFVSGGLYGIGLVNFWNTGFAGNVIYGSPVMIIFSYFRFFPVAFLLMNIALMKVPVSFDEITVLNYRPGSPAYLRMLVPQIRPELAGIFILIFVFCFTELDTTVLTYPPGMETIPLRIFALIHYGTHEMVAAISLWQLIFIGLGVLLLYRLFRQKSILR